MLAEQFGRGWRQRFAEFDEVPGRRASIGQVHRAVWHDGREVAVKVQYPGAEQALLSDLRQLSRMSRLMQPLVPGLEIKPLITELQERMSEELDYRDEAAHQRAFAAAYDGDEHVRVPRVVASAPKALVSEWITGRKLSDVIARGTQAERDHAAAQLSEFHYSAPERTGLLHSDPHPGNFQLLDDGRLMVLDYGRRRPAARRHAEAAVGDGAARAGRPARGPARAPAARGVRPGRLVDDPRRRAGLPRAVRGAAAHAVVPVRPGVAAEAGRARRRPAQPALQHRPRAEPAAAVPADPPRHDGHARRAVPARRRRPPAGIVGHWQPWIFED
jgi:predicted kinase